MDINYITTHRRKNPSVEIKKSLGLETEFHEFENWAEEKENMTIEFWHK